MNDRSPPAFAFPTAEHPAQAEKVASAGTPQPDDNTLDQAIAESFPASDPVSVTVSEPPAAGRRAAHESARG